MPWKKKVSTQHRHALSQPWWSTNQISITTFFCQLPKQPRRRQVAVLTVVPSKAKMDLNLLGWTQNIQLWRKQKWSKKCFQNQLIWLVVSTHLKNIGSNWKSSSRFRVKIKNIWNHHPANCWFGLVVWDWFWVPLRNNPFHNFIRES